jgi:plastocyanin
VTRRAGALLVAALLGAMFAAPAAGRRHRLHLTPAELPRSLAVDEKEWVLRPSETVVAAGVVRICAYDRGEDKHNVVIVGPRGAYGTVSLTPGTSGTIIANLRPGAYRLICSLFAGTPESHEARGMHATLTVR